MCLIKMEYVFREENNFVQYSGDFRINKNVTKYFKIFIDEMKYAC